MVWTAAPLSLTTSGSVISSGASLYPTSESRAALQTPAEFGELHILLLQGAVGEEGNGPVVVFVHAPSKWHETAPTLCA